MVAAGHFTVKQHEVSCSFCILIVSKSAFIQMHTEYFRVGLLKLYSFG